ncbi:hypothetical protein I2I05_15775 [Hymenobacter sp. BT683]|uniref:GWxTD domain-containing protein n=1 Tax=Hymenobacter jeongseonensis TaxID=2791027 RepID=A0ABS0IKF4_9BACT|nr:hypothetical protein [Hymenobacter jeongseonensis]MBF9238862.1 hypothetical protein [Hymenobacter jeongseonensis]
MPSPLQTSVVLIGALACLVIGPGCVRKQYFQADARPDSALAQPLSASADSVHGVTAGRQYARHGRLYHALIGRHYRSTWAAPIAAPVLRLATAQPGGLRPGKVGGGFNSTSLNLSTPTGQGYVLRTVDKDPIRATPKLLQGTFLVNVLRDNVSSTNPYASLVVPPFAQALGVARAQPSLYYVRPDDAFFQTDSLRLFRGQLAYLEEKYAVAPPSSGAGNPASSTTAFTGVFASPNQRMDQAALLRARLLDGWLGDWDRHAGQWNWLVRTQPNAGFASILPLPKDRDMVFYRLDDGVLGWLIGHLAIRHWTTFRPRYPNIAHLMSNGKYLDERSLNQLSRADFEAAARAMQQKLPDSLIGRAVRRMPAAAFALEGPGIISALQARRAALPAFAAAYYRQLAQHVLVGGTAQAERFEIHRYRDSTVVTVRLVTAGSSDQPPQFRRTFLPAETRTIQLEGLAGNDIFTIEQHGNQPVRLPALRLYGGPGTDELPTNFLGRGASFSQDSAPAKSAYDQPPKE